MSIAKLASGGSPDAWKIAAALLLPLVAAGCLSSSVPVAKHWIVEYKGPVASVAGEKFGVGQLLHVSVRAPFNDKGITVLRADGSAEVDPCNAYLAAPPQMMKAVVLDAMAASRLFTIVTEAGSVGSADTAVEVTITRLALDCRSADSRLAVAKVEMRLLQDHKIVKTAVGEGTASAADGNYSAAFSGAVSDALAAAFNKCRN